MVRTLQQVALLPQKLARDVAAHGLVDPVGASWSSVQTQGTPASWTPRYESQVQRSGLAHSLPHIVHGLPMPSSFASAGGHPGGGFQARPR